MIVTKPLDLPLLQQQLAAGGVAVAALGSHETQTPGAHELYTFDGEGRPLELPPAAVPIVDAHVAPPRAVDHAGVVPVDAVTATTDDVQLEVFRFATTPQHVYDAQFKMTAIDRTSGTTKVASAEMVFKRTATALQQVGATAAGAAFADTGTASWAIVATVDRTDLVISVRGAAGRTIDWLLAGSVAAFAPGGLAG